MNSVYLRRFENENPSNTCNDFWVSMYLAFESTDRKKLLSTLKIRQKINTIITSYSRIIFTEEKPRIEFIPFS